MSKHILLPLLNCSWQWMFLCGVTWFVAKCFLRSNPTVYLLWLLSLLSLPILFGLNQFVPALSIEGTGSKLGQTEQVNILGLSVLTTDLTEVSAVEGTTQSESQLLSGASSFANWDKTDILLGFWAIGALTMLIHLLFGLYRICQLQHRAVVADESYQAICGRLAKQLDIDRPVTVYLSDRVVSPISFGWLSPCILIPGHLNVEQFELVAIHELAHVQRLDWLTNLFSHFIGVIFFFHPAYHFLNRELTHLRERICDDWVIQFTGARKSYAQCLLDLVQHENRIIPPVLSLNQGSRLGSRIDSILKNNRRLDVQPKPRLRLIGATLLLTFLPLLATAQLAPLKALKISLFVQAPQQLEERFNEKSIAAQLAQPREAVHTLRISAAKWKADSRQLHKQSKEHTHAYEKRLQGKGDAQMNLETSKDNQRYPVPQHWEKRPSLKMMDIRNEVNSKMFERATGVDQGSTNLFWQDNSEIGTKGLMDMSELPFEIGDFQRSDSDARNPAIFNQEFQSCSLKMMLARKKIAGQKTRKNLIKDFK